MSNDQKLPRIEDHEEEGRGFYLRISVDPDEMALHEPEKIERIRKVLAALDMLED